MQAVHVVQERRLAAAAGAWSAHERFGVHVCIIAWRAPTIGCPCTRCGMLVALIGCPRLPRRRVGPVVAWAPYARGCTGEAGAKLYCMRPAAGPTTTVSVIACWEVVCSSAEDTAHSAEAAAGV
eukprot:scaffold34048_cov71-Phaeocystis_antarctica.AAC.1